MNRIFRAWLPYAVTLTVACGLVQVAVQQSYRNSADDPQIQMAEDAAAALSAGQSPQGLVGAGTVDMAESLAPYLIVTDAAGNVLASNAQLDGQSPVPPVGTLAHARANGRNNVTWQPAPYVRVAAVVAPYSGSNVSGFVVAGRSLREVEIRESQLTAMVACAWFAGLVLTFLAVVFGLRENKPSHAR